MSYLQVKKGRWHFRIVLPKDVRTALGDRAEITKALGTSSRREATILAAPHIAEWHEKIEQARQQNSRELVFTVGPLRVKKSATSFDLETEDGTPISSHSLREGLYREVARDWFEQSWRAHFDAAARSHYTEHESKERVDPAIVYHGVVSQYEKYKPILPSRSRFTQACVGMINRNFKYESNRLNSKDLFPENGGVLDSDDFDFYREETLLSGTTISDAVSEYFGGAHKVRPKTSQLWRARFAILVEYLGEDMRLSLLTSTAADAFRKALLGFPKRRPADLKGFSESVAWAADRKAPVLTEQTVNAYTNALRAMLNPACKRLGIKNPFSGLKTLKGKAHAERKYLEFTDSEIKLIFGKTFCVDGRGRYASAADYWTMLGLLLHGGRINEWAQARTDQFLVQDGVFIFRVGGTVKTEASARDVPIHSAMLKLGFRDFCEKAPARQLFTDLTETEEGQFSAALSKRCNRAIDRAGVDARRKVVHSFRHTWITRARTAGVEKQWTDRIAGHEVEGQGAKYGSYSIRVAKRLTDRVQFELDMTHLAEVWRNIRAPQKRLGRPTGVLERRAAPRKRQERGGRLRPS